MANDLGQHVPPEWVNGWQLIVEVRYIPPSRQPQPEPKDPDVYELPDWVKGDFPLPYDKK